VLCWECLKIVRVQKILVGGCRLHAWEQGHSTCVGVKLASVLLCGRCVGVHICITVTVLMQKCMWWHRWVLWIGRWQMGVRVVADILDWCILLWLGMLLLVGVAAVRHVVYFFRILVQRRFAMCCVLVLELRRKKHQSACDRSWCNISCMSACHVGHTIVWR